ncbi:hypothetical protein TNCV_1680231 [Trichonephila clavipes]|nr:hypothetical protein TNCV_1680231 [Trichonephila clavipes]
MMGEKINHDVKVEQIKKSSHKKRGGRTYPQHENALTKQSAGWGKNAGRKTGRPKAVNQDGGEITSEPRVNGAVQNSNRIVKSLDTLREDCGIIRKQVSTDGGVLWKVVCVNVVQVRRKDRTLRDPREARSRVRV